MVENLVSAPYICLWSNMLDGIFSILAAGSFTFLPGLPRISQKGKRWSQYELGVSFSRTLHGPFVLNDNFTCFLTTTGSPVSNYLMIFPLLGSSLCLRLLSYTRMLNNSLCLNRSGDASSEWYKACCPSGLPFLKLYGDRSIVNGNSLPVTTTDWSIPAQSTRPAFQYYSAKNTTCDHCWSLPLSAEFIFYNLFR